MTKQTLIAEHYTLWYNGDDSSNDTSHAKISIQYAIIVLEGLANGYQIMTEDGVCGIPTDSLTSKITELKNLL